MPTVTQIIESAASAARLRASDITSHDRTRPIVKARQNAALRLRNELRMSYPEIARALGMRSHATAIAAVNRAAKSAGLPPVAGHAGPVVIPAPPAPVVQPMSHRAKTIIAILNTDTDTRREVLGFLRAALTA